MDSKWLDFFFLKLRHDSIEILKNINCEILWYTWVINDFYRECLYIFNCSLRIVYIPYLRNTSITFLFPWVQLPKTSVVTTPISFFSSSFFPLFLIFLLNGLVLYLIKKNSFSSFVFKRLIKTYVLVFKEKCAATKWNTFLLNGTKTFFFAHLLF